MSTPADHDATREHHLREDMHLSRDVNLKRALGVSGLTMFGLAYLVPLTVFTTYGIVTERTGGRVAYAYVFTSAVMLFTALSYGRMVEAYPVSGSAYTYTSRTFGPHLGFLAGWALLLDYILLPMVNYAVIGLFINAQWPSIPLWVGFVASLALVTVLNVIGITTIDKANSIIIAIQTVFCIVFVILAVKTMAGGTIQAGLPFTGDHGQKGERTGPSWPERRSSVCCSLDRRRLDDGRGGHRTPATSPARFSTPPSAADCFILLSWLAPGRPPVDDLRQCRLRRNRSHDPHRRERHGRLLHRRRRRRCLRLGPDLPGVRHPHPLCHGPHAAPPAGHARREVADPRHRHCPGLARLDGRPLARPRAVFLDRQLGALTAFSVVNLCAGQALLARPACEPNLVLHLVLLLIGFALTVWLWTLLSVSARPRHRPDLAGRWIAWLAAITGGFRNRPPQVEFEG